MDQLDERSPATYSSVKVKGKVAQAGGPLITTNDTQYEQERGSLNKKCRLYLEFLSGQASQFWKSSLYTFFKKNHFLFKSEIPGFFLG